MWLVLITAVTGRGWWCFATVGNVKADNVQSALWLSFDLFASYSELVEAE